jgi:hypothetical protein
MAKDYLQAYESLLGEPAAAFAGGNGSKLNWPVRTAANAK